MDGTKAEAALDAIAALRDQALRNQRAAEDAAEAHALRGDQDRLRLARSDIERYLERASAFGLALRAAQIALDGGNKPAKGGND